MIVQCRGEKVQLLGAEIIRERHSAFLPCRAKAWSTLSSVRVPVGCERRGILRYLKFGAIQNDVPRNFKLTHYFAAMRKVFMRNSRAATTQPVGFRSVAPLCPALGGAGRVFRKLSANLNVVGRQSGAHLATSARSLEIEIGDSIERRLGKQLL